AQKSLESRRKSAIYLRFFSKISQQQLNVTREMVGKLVDNKSLPKEERKRSELISMVQELSPKEASSANHLINIDKCNGKSVSETVQIIMKNSQIDPNKCF
ncbi:10300_t:CDS:2, partial [Cetraspora pellucida]